MTIVSAHYVRLHRPGNITWQTFTVDTVRTRTQRTSKTQSVFGGGKMPKCLSFNERYPTCLLRKVSGSIFTQCVFLMTA